MGSTDLTLDEMDWMFCVCGMFMGNMMFSFGIGDGEIFCVALLKGTRQNASVTICG